MNIAPYIDHTMLKPVMTLEDTRNLCAEATQYSFAAVCLPPPLVRNARAFLVGSSVKTATVVGFPFGYSAAKAKVFEVQQAIEDGVDELDMVINLIALRNKAWSYLEGEVKHIIEAAHKNGKILKVIIESGVLTDAEIIECCKLYGDMGVDFLKTSTGYAEKGATLEAVQLMRANLPSNIKIKASGGIRTATFARQLIGAGADRLGCSASVAIVKEEQGAEGY